MPHSKISHRAMRFLNADEGRQRFRPCPEETKTVDGEHSYPIYFDWVLIALRRCEHPDSYESQFSQIATYKLYKYKLRCYSLSE